MPSDDRELLKEVPDSLNFSQAQVNFILGHSLRGLYQDVLCAPIPAHLEALLLQLERAQAQEN